MKYSKSSGGFSLIELMVTLIIVGILATSSAPSFRLLLLSVKMETTISAMERTLRFARRQALTTSNSVNICASVDQQFCDSERRWNQGWIVYADTLGNRDRQPGDTLIRTVTKKSTLNIRYNRGKWIATNQAGRIVLNSALIICGHNVAAITAGISAKLVMVHSGRLRLQRDTEICA